MARGLHQLICGAVLAGLGLQASADPEPGEKKKYKDGQATPSAEFANVRKALDALSPEQRKRFQENFLRWSNLPPEEKKALREREEVRKKFMEQELQAAVQESGLQLEGEQRAQFAARYGEERRKIEEQLRKEMMEKRRPLVKDLIARLKAEFSGGTSDPVLAPAAAAKP